MTIVKLVRFADGSINTTATVDQAGRDYAARCECGDAASLVLGFQTAIARHLIHARIPASADVTRI